MDLFLIVVISLVFALICHVMARKRNRNPVLWAFLGFCFGPIPVLVLAVIGRHARNQ